MIVEFVMKITENNLRKALRKILEETDHKWLDASDKLLMLDRNGIEKSDRENIIKYFKSMGLIK
jgi:excinuclease UvrABC ATPase subunit